MTEAWKELNKQEAEWRARRRYHLPPLTRVSFKKYISMKGYKWVAKNFPEEYARFRV